MPKESDGASLLSASDRAIYQYLDEMLSDPNEGSESRSSQQKPEIPPPSEKQPTATLSTPAPQAQKLLEAPKPLATKEKAQPQVLTSSETLLSFEKPIVVQQPAAKEKPVATKNQTRPETKAKIETKKLAEAPNVVPDPVVDPDEVINNTQESDRLPPMTPWCDNGRPEWAQNRFECLLFQVGGLKLAVPLVTLGAIHQIDRKFHHLPGQHDWFIGILQTNVGNIKVLDTALCVMPEKYDPSMRDDIKYVITLHGFEWGISCHEILRSITLEPEDVKWRTQRGKRPWLAGTVVDQMCALLDTAGFHHVIYEAENKKT